MTIEPGSQLGVYEVLGPLGAGGMGEVYRARDARLGRDVAIKVVSPRFHDSADALIRLEREARAAAALSHPNIVAIYDVGRDGGVTFAVMELLDGETLDRIIAAGPLPPRQALEIAAAIAEGVAAAHARGIVHRDLKPSNIFVTRDGVVKILDFGLATVDALEGAADTTLETAPGTVLGTVGYMAPEQVRGEEADHRTDIFSIGCVLFEMLTGEPAFRRATVPETFAAILRDRPRELRSTSHMIPSRAETLVHRCLEKDPDRRFQSARDLAFALRDVRAELSHVGPRWRGRWLALAGATVLLLAAVASWRLQFVRSLLIRRAPIRSVAVLPLANRSADRQLDAFAAALTDQLTSRVASIGVWRVTSSASAGTYAGTQKTIPEIATELGVDAVVQGTVLRERGRVSLSAHLVDARTGRQIWSSSYDRSLEDLLALRDEVARALVRATDVEVESDARADITGPGALHPLGWDAYVRGRYAWNKRSESDLRAAIRYFQESIDADPTYAPAFAGMADAYGQLGYGSYVAPEDAFPRARAAALRALELDPTLADAHASLAYALMYYEWKFDRAEAEFRRAIALNPSYAVAHQWYAYLITAMERPFSQAEREIATARDLDPLSPAIFTDRAYILHYYGRNDEALRSVDVALEMNPKFPLGYFWLGRIFTAQGRYAEAERAFLELGPMRTWTPAMAALGYMYGRAGRKREANGVLGEFASLAQQGRYASAYAVAAVLAGLGERERALTMLETALRERSHWLVWLKRDPRFDDIRPDPRFVDLTRKVGLPQ